MTSDSNKETRPIRRQPCRAGQLSREMLHEMFLKQLKDNLNESEPVQAERAGPIVFITKKNSFLQVCVDYRPLNYGSIPQTSPLPRMNDCTVLAV